jgi:hypothetical protein
MRLFLLVHFKKVEPRRVLPQLRRPFSREKTSALDSSEEYATSLIFLLTYKFNLP